MTVEEFEQKYATTSGMTVEKLRSLGFYGAPCDCDWVECEGWQIVHPNDPANDPRRAV